MDRLTDEQIAELRKLEKAATPGPWRLGESRQFIYLPSGRCLQDDGYEGEVEPANGALIAALRNAVPALLDEVEEARNAICGETDASGKSICFLGRNHLSAHRGRDGMSWVLIQPKLDRAASALLAALDQLIDRLSAGEVWNEVNYDVIDGAKAAIALARDAGIGTPE